MSDDFDLLTGVDAPRPLPAHLRRRLELALTGEDPVVVALGGADAPRPVPDEVADRIAATLTGDGPVAMPAPVRRRIERSLVGRPTWSRGVAVAAALLLVAASAIALSRTGSPDRDEVAATGSRPTNAPAETAPEAIAAPEVAVPPAAETIPPTTATRRSAAVRATPTTAAAAPTAESGAAAGARGSDSPSAAAAASPAPPSVSVEPTTVRRGEEVTARARGFSTQTVAYTVRAPSGRAVLEGEARPEFRFTVPLYEETGRYTLVVENTDRTQRAEAYLDVVVA